MNSPYDEFIRRIGDHELIFRFFVIFSRFEYAMKRCRCFKRSKVEGESRRAEPDWDALAIRTSICGRLQNAGNESVAEAYAYLINNPPKTEIVVGSSIDFVPTLQSDDHTDERHVLSLVQKVRNNLFHGGKFQSGPVLDFTDRVRNGKLIASSIVILEHCLSTDAELSKEFFELT